MPSTGVRLRRILQHWLTKQFARDCFIFTRCSMRFYGSPDRGRRDLSSRNWKDFSSVAALKQYAQRYHEAVNEAVSGFDEVKLEALVEAPWFEPPVKLSRRHALTQAAMHSHYHRGQNATRLPELGGVPPITDFIIWLRNGKPAARWT